MTEGAWLVPRGLTSPRARLFVFHAAGATGALYLGWLRRVPADVELWLWQSAEPQPPTVADLAEGALAGMADKLDAPFTLLGHSFGSICAYEVGVRLRSRGTNVPRRQVALCFPGPAAYSRHLDTSTPLHTLPDADFLREMAAFGGIPGDPARVAALLPGMLPRLRDHFRMGESWRYTPAAPLEWPLLAVSGAEDPIVRPEMVETWRVHAGGGFEHRRLAGGHFFPVQPGGLGALFEVLTPLL